MRRPEASTQALLCTMTARAAVPPCCCGSVRLRLRPLAAACPMTRLRNPVITQIRFCSSQVPIKLSRARASAAAAFGRACQISFFVDPRHIFSTRQAARANFQTQIGSDSRPTCAGCVTTDVASAADAHSRTPNSRQRVARCAAYYSSTACCARRPETARGQNVRATSAHP